MSKMKINVQLIKNEIIDFLELNNILHWVNATNIEIMHPVHGKCTYYPKADKLQIHAKNKWIENAFYLIKKLA